MERQPAHSAEANLHSDSQSAQGSGGSLQWNGFCALIGILHTEKFAFTALHTYSHNVKSTSRTTFKNATLHMHHFIASPDANLQGVHVPSIRTTAAGLRWVSPWVPNLHYQNITTLHILCRRKTHESHTLEKRNFAYATFFARARRRRAH